MNILVINPPAANGVRIVREGRCMQRQEAWGTSWAPLSLALIGAILRDSGFQVRVEDCSNDGVSFEELGRMVSEFNPSFIVVNTATPSIASDLRVASLVRAIQPAIPCLFFGIHVSALPEETFELNPDVQFLIVGEPEYTIRDFALALKNKTPLSGIQGLVYKENGHLIRNAPRPWIENLDELPYPAWDLVDIGSYRLPLNGEPFLLVLTGRGCPYPCTFCAAGVYYGKRTRLRSPEKIVAEMKWVKEKYGVSHFLFWSENGTADRNQICEISKQLTRQNPGIRWACNARVDQADEEALSLMKAGGCWMIGYGVESGSQRVLDLMRKNIKIEDIQRAARLTKKAGIEMTAHVMVGYPGETREDIAKTMKLVGQLDFDYVQPYCFVPFPGSEAYSEVKRKGYLVTGDWARFEQNFSVVTTPELSFQEAMLWRSRLANRFYFHPKRIFKMLRKMKSLAEFRCLLVLARGYFGSWLSLRQRQSVK